jgi:hypothetical protein
MVQRIAACLLVSVACGVFAQVATGEIRTGSHSDKFADSEPTGSPTRPVFDHVTLRYDSTAGSLQAVITFTTGLADPAQTSALRPWSYRVSVGDFLGSVCTGDLDTWLYIEGRLGSDQPAQLVDVLDIDDSTPDPSVSTQFNADRSQLTLAVTDPRLIGLNLICAEATVAKDDDPKYQYQSGSFPFLLDGFSRLDGEITRDAQQNLEDNIGFLDRDWGRPGKARKFWSQHIRCRRLYRDTVSCRSSSLLPSVPGRPRLTLHGTLVFPQPYREDGIETRWTHHMRGSVSWKHCPRRLKVPRRLVGKPCHLNVRWTGHGDLTHSFR